MNKINYEKISEEKRNIDYNFIYESSSTSQLKAELGTIEKDASRRFGDHVKEPFRGYRIFEKLKTKEYQTVLDVGAGKLEAAREFHKLGKTVDIVDFEDSYYLKSDEGDHNFIHHFYKGNVIDKKIDKKYDLLWCSHVLEHQVNPNIFLKKIHSLIKEGGFLALVIPPRKPFIVSGHVSMWNGGLLIYHLILAGFDCSNIQLIQYDYNIGVILEKKTIKNPLKLNFDIGDFNELKNYFPFEVKEGFNGDIMNINF